MSNTLSNIRNLALAIAPPPPMPNQPLDLESLAAQVALGDPVAEQMLSAELLPGIRVLARCRARPNEPDLGDMVQDAIRIVLERLRAGALRDYAALRAFVQSIVHNTVTAAYRRRYRSVEVSDDLLSDRTLADELGPESRTRRRELAESVRSLIDTLPTARDREVLRLYYLRELERDDVCAQLSLDHVHFRRVIHRARVRFRAVLEQAEIDLELQ